jgi:hypothetical protein
MGRGYVVECFTDAPMRARAWFESLGDAEEYGRRAFGTSMYVHADSELTSHALEADREEFEQHKCDARAADDGKGRELARVIGRIREECDDAIAG